MKERVEAFHSEPMDPEANDAYDIPPLLFTKRMVPTESILKVAILVLIWALSFRYEYFPAASF